MQSKSNLEIDEQFGLIVLSGPVILQMNVKDFNV